jgi:hypothetical protein
MLFNTAEENFFEIESERERNLYSKIFSGYIFNEIVPGYEDRVQKFIKLIFDNIAKGYFSGHSFADTCSIEQLASSISLVTYDFHLFQTGNRNNKIDPIYKDRGEVSDILIWLKEYLISIECKYTTDCEYEKDIKQVQSRIKALALDYSRKPIQILLIKESKWNNSKKRRQKNSFYKYFISHLGKDVPCVLMFWEQIISLYENETVKAYLSKQLNRKTKKNK